MLALDSGGKQLPVFGEDPSEGWWFIANHRRLKINDVCLHTSFESSGNPSPVSSVRVGSQRVRSLLSGGERTRCEPHSDRSLSVLLVLDSSLTFA